MHHVHQLLCVMTVEINVCDFSRGLEDIQVSCASIHSDHSSGLSKTLQDYRYAPTHTFHFLDSFFSHLLDFAFLIKKLQFLSFFRALFFGENEIAVRVPSLFKLLIKEVSFCTSCLTLFLYPHQQ